MKPTAKELTNQITEFVNTFSTSESNEFIDEMNCEHRTLQQSFTRLCLKWLENCASENYKHDDRNQASYEISGELLYPFRSHHGFDPSKFLPMI